MKAPQDCTGVNVKTEAKKAKKKKNKDGDDDDDADSVYPNGSLRRSSTGSSSITPSITTMNSVGVVTPMSPQRNTSISAPRQGSITKHISAAPPPVKYANKPVQPGSISNGGGVPKAKALYQYDAQSSEELSIKPSEMLTIVEPDDGSGWILARTGKGEGLVPASYVELQTSEPAKKAGPPVAPRRGGKKVDEPKKKQMRALFDYQAGSKLELSIREGDVLTLVSEDRGDGWTEVELNGNVGSVPSNYIEAC
jgi:formin-binding protein 1